MLDDRDILGLVAQELAQAEVYTNWQYPLDYYLGNPNGLEIEGRSQVVSTDVADAIEWIMPQIMKALTQNNEVVIFDPVGPGDEAQADLESAYVYDVIMKENPGFIILHNFIKDALLHNNGVLKCYYEPVEKVQKLSFTGLSDPELFAAIQQNPTIEVLQYSQDPLDGTHAIKVAIRSSHGRIVLQSVAPENFRYNRGHNSVDLSSARFTAEILVKTISDLVQEGHPKEILDDIGDNAGYNRSYFRFTAQGESIDTKYISDDPSMREIEVAECYMFMDIDEDGIAERVKVTVAGNISPTHLLSAEEIEDSPWIATTGILMPHKYRGLSIYDRLKQIQEQKTALFRNMFDNLYLQNNQRTVAVEGMVNMDDLLVSRPGGIIRAKRLDAVTSLVTPPLGQEAYTMMTYLDQVRAGRVGVSPEGTASPQQLGERVGSQGLDRVMNASEELVGLIIRVIAETGIKPLCVKIRDLCAKHIDAVKPYKYRGTWVQVSPASWAERDKTTVRVGTGTGNHQKQQAALTQVLAVQAQIVAQPGQALVNPAKIYATLDDLCKFSELNGAAKYFVDPASPEGQQAAQAAAQAQQQSQAQAMQSQVATLQAEATVAQAQMKLAQAEEANVQLKAQNEQLKQKLELAIADSNSAHKDADRALTKYKIDTDAALKITALDVQSKKDEADLFIKARKETASDITKSI